MTVEELVASGLSLEEAIELADRLRGITANKAKTDELNGNNSKKILSRVVGDHTIVIGEVDWQKT